MGRRPTTPGSKYPPPLYTFESCAAAAKSAQYESRQLRSVQRQCSRSIRVQSRTAQQQYESSAQYEPDRLWYVPSSRQASDRPKTCLNGTWTVRQAGTSRVQYQDEAVRDPAAAVQPRNTGSGESRAAAVQVCPAGQYRAGQIDKGKTLVASYTGAQITSVPCYS